MMNRIYSNWHSWLRRVYLELRCLFSLRQTERNPQVRCMMRIISVVPTTVFALSGCATNMATVGVFSKSTQELAGQSVDMLSKYAGQCGERLAIVEHERGGIPNFV